MSRSVKRLIAVACVLIGLAVLGVEDLVLHDRRLAVCIAPFVAVACGLDYLRATRRRR